MLTLRPYQAEAIDFLVDRGRACLFDEPGLGKCMQSLLSMRELDSDGQLLVVAPGDAIGVWPDEVEKWLGEDAGVWAGVNADLAALDASVVITNYARLPQVFDKKHLWSGVIFDESQALRNRNTTTLFKFVKTVFDNRAYGMRDVPVFFLSGTPIVKSVGDIWPMLHVVDRKRWRGYWPFVQDYALVWQDQFGWHVEGVGNVTQLWADLDDVVLRRLRKDVQKWLPIRTRQPIRLTMTPKQAKAYYQLEKDMMAEIDDGSLFLTPSVLSLETRLRQLLVMPRWLGIEDDGAGVNLLKEVATDHNRPFVVYTPFVKPMPMIADALAKASKRQVFLVHGGMGQRFRQSVEDFKARANAGEDPILLSNIKMAKGWDVSRQTFECYMLGLEWNEVDMEQAESRLDRDGQVNGVMAYYLLHNDSHDDDALAVLSGKRRLAEVILDRKVRKGRIHS